MKSEILNDLRKPPHQIMTRFAAFTLSAIVRE